ncbi:MAG: glycoside hydrolase family 31 protein [Bacteroidota bacterium]|nr:glycoside hydrolase family 31 protein [Bacteroidota bacterium]
MIKKVKIFVLLSFVLEFTVIIGNAQVNIKTIAKEILVGQGYETGASLVGLGNGAKWKDVWNGSKSGATIQEPGLEVSGVQVASKKIQLLTNHEDVAVFRSLEQPLGGDESTVWLSFLIKKERGNRYFGLSCFQDGKEKLFAGTPNGDDNIRLGTNAMTSANAKSALQVVIRIDFRKGQDIAYLFINPGTASDPDIEGANAVFKGDLSFNRIRLAIGGSETENNAGCIGPVFIATRFADVANPSRVGTVPAVAGDKLQVLSWEKRDRALLITTPGGMLKIQPFLDQVLHIQFGTLKSIAEAKSFAVLRNPDKIEFDVHEKGNIIELATKQFSVQIAKTSSQISIYDASGKKILQESPEGARSAVSGDNIRVADRFQLTSSDALYGLGQYRDNLLNLRGKQRELVQVNTQAAVPVVLSTNGWGLFWDNPSRTIFRDSEKGMSFLSDVGSTVSFYVFVGAKLDNIVQDYRRLTGEAPMIPSWALGLHQSRNKYATQEQVLSVTDRMRKEKIPMSSIFIDYFYWSKYGTGSHRFDEGLFPDVKGMIQKLHNDYHTKVVVTVWPSFKPGIKNYEAFHKDNFLLDGAKALDGIVYDAFNPKASEIYWNQVAENLVPLGIDGWFLDGPEPDNVTSFLSTTTFAGPALAVRNLFPLVHSTTFYNGLLAVNPNCRPYIITRCAWAGQQRNGTAVWSGDIGSTFAELKTQVTAGLNFVASGIPYWTTDIGGYSGGNPADSVYRETFVRWWQYGTFCPIFRTHGRRYPGDTKGSNELWAFGPKVQDICNDFANLRYRLMPYIYSLTAEVTQKDYTPMRLLAFDFAEDTSVLNITDEFMYGPAFLVSPVTSLGVVNREVYLPDKNKWVDFWTGEEQKGGQKIVALAPLNRIPLYVRVGSIIPMGPVMQYTGEKSTTSLDLRIYKGANGSFELYEDDGETFNYKNGQYTRILFTWDEASQTLTIGKRKGNFPGMLKKRTFNIVFVKGNSGVGINTVEKPDYRIKYKGELTVIKIRN